MTGFGRLADQLIVLIGRESFYTHQNVFAARSLGGTGAAGWTSPGQLVALEGNVTWQDFRNVSTEGQFGAFSGQRIPNRPYLQANGSARFQLSSLMSSQDELSLTWHARYVHAFFRAWEGLGQQDSKQVVPSQFLHSLALTYVTRASRTTMSWTVDVQNLHRCARVRLLRRPAPRPQRLRQAHGGSPRRKPAVNHLHAKKGTSNEARDPPPLPGALLSRHSLSRSWRAVERRSPSPGESTTPDTPLYAITTQIVTTDTPQSYVVLTDTVDVPETLKLETAIELPGRALGVGIAKSGALFVGGSEAPTVTRYNLTSDGKPGEGRHRELRGQGRRVHRRVPEPVPVHLGDQGLLLRRAHVAGHHLEPHRR